MKSVSGSDRPVNYFRFLTSFFGFGVKGAGGEDSKRLSVSSARFNAAASTGGRASFRVFSICGS